MLSDESGGPFFFFAAEPEKAMPHENTPQTEPASVVAGDTWTWERVLSDHPPSDGWTLGYSFVGPSKLSVEAQAVGETYVITVAAANTAKLLPGTYRWIGYVTKASERFTIGDGLLIVRPDLAEAAAASSHAERMVDLLETALEDLATLGSTTIEINGRQADQIPMDQLRRMLGYYRSEIRRNRNPRQLGRVEVHFGST